MRVNGTDISRWLAPLALLACALAVVVILTSSGSSGSSSNSGSSGTAAGQRTSSTKNATTASKRRKAAKRKAQVYTVKPGDTLSAIAEKTGVALSELQAFNPNLDSESLQNGQKVKLGP